MSLNIILSTLVEPINVFKIAILKNATIIYFYNYIKSSMRNYEAIRRRLGFNKAFNTICKNTKY